MKPGRLLFTSLLVFLVFASNYQHKEAQAAEKDFQRKLKIVEQYEKEIPKDSIAGEKTTASVRPYRGVPALHINDKLVYPMAFLAIGHFPKHACRDFAAAGVHLYSHIIWTWEGERRTPENIYWWLGPGRYDFEKIDRQIRAIIEGDPQAYILLRIKLNPPGWWLDAHPDEMVHYIDGRRGPQVSLASELWEQTYERMLRDLIRHIEASGYAGHIIGYQPAAGVSSEWYWWGSKDDFIDYSPAARRRFRKWLSERYRGELSALRKSWNDSHVTFQTADPPGKDAREKSEYMLFRDARKAGRVIDYQQFLSEMTAYQIIKSCRICKEETDGKKIAGVFYGYSLAWSYGQRMIGNCGLFGLRNVLDSPFVDFLCAPTDYELRRVGQPGNFMSGYTASYFLHNKLYWDEADYATHLTSKDSQETQHLGRTDSLAETLSLLRRAFGYTLTRGTALWWFTLAGDHTFHQDEIMEDIKRMEQIGQAAMNTDRGRIHDVAVFVDEPSFFYMRYGIRELGRPLIWDMYYSRLPRMGAPFDMYLLSDIANENIPDYKLYIFLNPFYVTDTLREAIKKKTRKNGAVSVWFYAPGFIKEDGTFSEEAMRDLTGIRIRHRAEERELALSITDFHHTITSGADASNGFQPTGKLGPVFYADDPEAVVVGRLNSGGEAGMVVRNFGSWRSVYCAVPGMPTSVLRGLIQFAGGHVYCESDDVLDANRSFLMIHTSTSGHKKIVLPEPRDVYDVLQGQQVGRSRISIEVELPGGVTRIYRLAKPRQ